MSGAMKAAVLALLCLLSAAALPCLGQKDAYKLLTAMREEWPLPDLPYSYDALEPHLDEATLRVHHQGHFKTYTQGMNKAMRAFGDLVSLRRCPPWHAAFPDPSPSSSPCLDAGIQTCSLSSCAHAGLCGWGPPLYAEGPAEQRRGLPQPRSLLCDHVPQQG